MTTVTLPPTITHAGEAAAFAFGNTGIQVQITHVGFGTAGYVPTGNETALAAEVLRVPVAGGGRISPTIIQVLASVQAASLAAEFDCKEVGFFDANGVLFAVYSQASAAITRISYSVATTISWALELVALPASSVTVQIDPGASVTLSLLGNHLTDPAAHAGIIPGKATPAEVAAGTENTKYLTPYSFAQTLGKPTVNGYVLSSTTAGVLSWVAQSGGGGAAVETATHAATSKSTPVDADEIPLVDSAASNGLKKLTWANLKAKFEAPLGNPSANGYVLTSDTAGVRSWAAQSGGISGSGTANKIPVWTAGSVLGNSRLSVAASGNVYLPDATNPLLESQALNNFTVQTSIALKRFGGSAPHFALVGYGGTPSAPTTTQSGHGLGKFSANGYLSSDGVAYTQAAVNVTATENWTSTARGTKLSFTSTPNGSVTELEGLVVQGNVVEVPGMLKLSGSVGFGGNTDNSRTNWYSGNGLQLLLYSNRYYGGTPPSNRHVVSGYSGSLEYYAPTGVWSLRTTTASQAADAQIAEVVPISAGPSGVIIPGTLNVAGDITNAELNRARGTCVLTPLSQFSINNDNGGASTGYISVNAGTVGSFQRATITSLTGAVGGAAWTDQHTGCWQQSPTTNQTVIPRMSGAKRVTLVAMFFTGNGGANGVTLVCRAVRWRVGGAAFNVSEGLTILSGTNGNTILSCQMDWDTSLDLGLFVRIGFSAGNIVGAFAELISIGVLQ